MFGHDARFSPSRYGRNPLWLIQQAIAAARQQRNWQQKSTAEFMALYIGAHSKEGATPPKFYELLPHPIEWHRYAGDRQLIVSSDTARIVLSEYKKWGADALVVIDQYVLDLMACL